MTNEEITGSESVKMKHIYMSMGFCEAWNGVQLAEFLHIIHEACIQRPAKYTYNIKPAVMAQFFNPSTWKVEAEESDQDLRPLSQNKQRKSSIYVYNFVHEQLYPFPDFEAGLPCVLTGTELTTYTNLAWNFQRPYLLPKGSKPPTAG